MLGSHDRHRSQPMSGVATSRDGIRLAFEVHGTGTPTLGSVHGWSCDRRYWRGQLRLLAARYQTVAVDLAGHGQSGVGRRSWTMAAFGEDVVAVVEQLGLGELVLIGHSMGGDVVVEAPGAWVTGLRKLTVPVVAINPDARPTDAEALRRHGVKAVLVAGVGHFLMLEAPDRFNRLLGGVIEEFRS
jgi:pimeloyl-ACP methyl ester carboxylesterase